MLLIEPAAAPAFWITLLNYIGLYSIVALRLALLTGVAVQTYFGLAALAALGLGFITLRMKGHYLPLATIAWGTSIFYVFGNLDFLGGHTGLSGIAALSFFGWELRNERHLYYLIWLIALASLWTADNL